MNNTTKIIIGALIIIAVAGYGGFKYGQNNSGASQQSQSTSASGPFGSQGGSRGGRGGVGGGMTAGDIVKRDDQSLTLQLRDGSSKIVWFATSTEISKMTAGSVGDLISGGSIAVSGSVSPDGSIVAKAIQIRPAGN